MGSDSPKAFTGAIALVAFAALAAACSAARDGAPPVDGAAGSEVGGGAAGAGTGGNPDGGGPGGAGGSGSGGAAGAGGTVDGTPTIFYLDVAGQVMTAEAESPSPRTLVASAGQGPDGIAVDLAGGHIYWTNMGVPADDDGSLRRSDLDGSNVVTIVPAGGTYTPKQLKLDAAAGKLYWSDREGMRVQRASTDGSNVETLVTVATGATARRDLSNHCVGMALDTAGGWFYWTQKGPDNGGVGSIRRAHIQMPAGQTSVTRSDIEILYTGLPEPIDLDLDVASGTIYWADRGDDTISRGPVSHAAREILVTGVREAIGVAIDVGRGRLYYTGANGQLGRANLDGSGKRELTGAGAMTGIVIVDLP